jgi:hypothetical protein
MAKLYSFAEAVAVIADGTNLDEVIDVTTRFPNVAILAAKACAASPEYVKALAAAVPDYVSARKAENAIKRGNGQEGAEGEEAEAHEEKPAPAPKAAEKAAEEAPKPAPKRRGRPAKAKPEPEPEPEVDDEAAGDFDFGKYAGKKASELYKELKSRGISAKPRQTAEVYAEMLLEDDAKAKEADDAWDDDEDEDWDI